MLYFRIAVMVFCSFFCAVSIVSASCIGDEMSSGFCWPTEGKNLLLGWHGVNKSYLGKFHLAQDIKATEGDNVYAIADGIVLHSSMTLGGFGGVGIDGGALIIKYRNSSGNFFTAQYGHVKNISVGDKVLKGQKIAEIGPYTNGTVHLHFAIRFPFNDDDNRWSGYGTSDMGFVSPITFMNNHSPGHMFFRRVGDIEWAPANVSCINAETWRQWDGYGWVGIGRSNICYSVDTSLLMDDYWQEILFGDRNLNEIAQCRAE